MRRRLFSVLAAVSLGLCVATLALWARSYGPGDAWRRIRNGDICQLVSLRGQVVWLAGPATFISGPAVAYPIYRTYAGFGYAPRSTWSARCIEVPHWSLMLTTAILPALWLVQFRQRREVRRRRNLGLCLHCGYDLRASPERCPECGTPVPVT